MEAAPLAPVAAVAEGDGVEAALPVPIAAVVPAAAPVPEAADDALEPVVVLDDTGEPFTALEAAAAVLNASNDFAAVGLTAKTMPAWQCLSRVRAGGCGQHTKDLHCARRGNDALGLTAVEPERRGGVVDRNLPDWELGRGVDELEAGVDTGHLAGRAGDVGARCGERGLGDGVVLLQELELDDITVGDIRQPGDKS